MNYIKRMMHPLPTQPTPSHQHSHKTYKYGRNDAAYTQQFKDENTTHCKDGATKCKKYLSTKTKITKKLYININKCLHITDHK
jgi:hypothetical protein